MRVGVAVCMVTVWCLVADNLRAADEPRPEHFGVCLPMPEVVPQTIETNKAAHTTSTQVVPLRLTVGADGMVDSVTTPVDSLARFARYLRPYFDKVTFVPGSIDGIESEMQLSARAVFRHSVRRPRFDYPVDSLGRVYDRSLYFESLAANDVTLPEVVQFPSVFFDKARFDTADAIYPWALLQVNLDEQGKPKARKIVGSIIDTFAEQLRSALLYASYQPAEVNGQPEPSTLFVLVSFLPHQNYPTAVWKRDMPDTVSQYHRLLIRSFPDTVGLMSPPIIRHYPPEWYALSGPHTLQRGWLGTSVGVDPSGGTMFNVSGQWPREILTAVRRLSEQFRMYAALDYSGRPVIYDGEAMLGFVGSGLIRTRFVWLP